MCREGQLGLKTSIDDTDEARRTLEPASGSTGLAEVHGVNLRIWRRGALRPPVPAMRAGRWRIFLAIVAGLAAPMVATHASAGVAGSCGAIHTVHRGETLFKIAERAYGNGFLYDKIFAANRALLPDEGSLEIGDQILIPCLDGTGPAMRDEAMAQLGPERPSHDRRAMPAATEPSAEAETGRRVSPAGLAAEAARLAGRAMTPGHSIADLSTTKAVSPSRRKTPVRELALSAKISQANAEIVAARALATSTEATKQFDNPVRLVTTTGLTPFADPALTGGGMITDLVARAIREAEPDQPIEVNFVESESAQINAFLLNGMFDVGFPWHKPDCSRAGELNEETRLLCVRFDFSQPIIEAPIRFYMRVGNDLTNAGDTSALRGRKLCYPLDSSGFSLHVRFQQEFNASSETAGTGIACLVRLIQGQVDAVALNWQEADVQIHNLGIAGEIVEIAGPASGMTLHAIVPKSNPDGRSYLNLINRGLDQVMRSGEWFNVVAFHNSENAQGIGRR